MNLFDVAKNFKNDESGAVTVDWVVLTAALVGLGLAIILAIKPGINNAASKIAGELNAAASADMALTITP